MKSRECLEKIAPFLARLTEPRYDKYETNDYINNSTDCKNALKAFQEWQVSEPTSTPDEANAVGSCEHYYLPSGRCMFCDDVHEE